MTTDQQSNTQFLNVDLDIYSRSDLQPLVSALGRKVIVLHAGRYQRIFSAHLELTRTIRSADAAIRAFCVLIESLGRRERALWNASRKRDFSIGVDAGAYPRAYEFALAAGTLQAAARLGARVSIVVYAPGHSPCWGYSLAAAARASSEAV